MILQTHVRVSSRVFTRLRFGEPVRTVLRRLKVHKIAAKRDDDAVSSEVMESDFEFLLKGAVLTVTLACAIKYGSLIIELPFQPNGVISVLMVLIPTAVTSLFFKSKS